VAVLHRRAGLPFRGRVRRQAYLRLPRHHPRREHRGRHDRHRGRRALRPSPAHHRPHPQGSARREPRAVRPHPEARRHHRVGISSYFKTGLKR